jgi:maltokinase
MSEIPDVEQLLADWLPLQRWFVDPDRPILGLRLLAETAIGQTNRVVHHVVAVDQAGAGGSTTTVYQVPLAVRDEPFDRLEHVRVGTVESEQGLRHVYDALFDKVAAGRLLERLAAGADLGGLEFHPLPGAEIPVGEPSLALPGEQRSTSLAFGDQALLKVFRRLVPGTNPDVELHAALTDAACPYVAPLLGWFDGRWRDPSTGDEVSGSLAMLRRFFVTATDGWRLAVASLHDLLAEADLRADEVGGDFAAEASRLGQATAAVHAALAASLGSAAWTSEDRAQAAAALRQRLAEASAVTAVLDGAAPELDQLADALTADVEPVSAQRLHGDYHLGQVMRTALGWRLLDFEGDPGRPLAERTRPAPPAVDVAGMLFSLAYAAHTIADEDFPGDAQRAYRAQEWASRNRAAFCAGYAAEQGSDPREQPTLLRAAEAEIALRQVVLEARHRPHRVPVPVAILNRLADPTTPPGG